MIKILFSKLKHNLPSEIIEEEIKKLPLVVAERVLRYKDTRRTLSLSGVILLQKLMEEFAVDIDLTKLELNEFGKPFFRNNFYFNTTYTEDLVVCAGTTISEIGIDVEKIKPLELAYFQPYFTKTEWAIITDAKDKTREFFRLWTKKEAVLKAEGIGLLHEPKSIEVLMNLIEFKNKVYHITSVRIDDGYMCHLSCLFKLTIEIKEYNVLI